MIQVFILITVMTIIILSMVGMCIWSLVVLYVRFNRDLIERRKLVEKCRRKWKEGN